MRQWVRVFVVALALALVTPVSVDRAAAATEVVLSGIDNPRGVTVHGGTLFVASAGRGGDAMCIDRDGVSACFGRTGELLRVPGVASVTGATAGPEHVLNDGNPMPSIAEAGGRNAAGPADVAVGADGSLYYTIGLGGSHELREQLVEAAQDMAYRLATLRRMDAEDGGGDVEIVDLGNHERDTDPDGRGSRTDPFGLVVDTSRTHAAVLDTGGNSLVDVDIDGPDPAARMTTRVVLPRYGSGPDSLPAAPTQLVAHSGVLWAGQRVGDTAPAGSASIWSITDDVLAPWVSGGLTDVVDVAWHADVLYVLEQDHDGPGPSTSGALLRVTVEDGIASRRILVDDLDAPGGMAFDADDPGTIYVTTGSTGPGGAVVRIEDVPSLGVDDDGGDGNGGGGGDGGGGTVIVDRQAETADDHRLVAGDAEEDAYQTVAPPLTTDDSDRLEVIDAAHGAAWQGEDGLRYLPFAHQGVDDTVAYRVCDATGQDCTDGVLQVDVRPTATGRIAGPTRLTTAIEAAQGRYPDGSEAVLLARADLYPDALTGGPLAHAVGGPILLTSSEALHPEVADEIRRLDPSTIYLLGGPAALHDGVETAARSLAPRVERLSGGDRFATAARIRAELETVTDGPAELVVVVEGADPDEDRGWPDAVAASALAAHAGWPILLVTTDDVPSATADAVAGTDLIVVGGLVAVAASVEEELDRIADDVSRIAGDTRYETSRRVAERARAEGLDRDVLTLVSGGDWPDALVAGPLVARTGGAFLLVPPEDVTSAEPTLRFMADHGPFADVDLFGGLAAISADMEQVVASANR